MMTDDTALSSISLATQRRTHRETEKVKKKKICDSDNGIDCAYANDSAQVIRPNSYDFSFQCFCRCRAFVRLFLSGKNWNQIDTKRSNRCELCNLYFEPNVCPFRSHFAPPITIRIENRIRNKLFINKNVSVFPLQMCSSIWKLYRRTHGTYVMCYNRPKSIHSQVNRVKHCHVIVYSHRTKAIPTIKKNMKLCHRRSSVRPETHMIWLNFSVFSLSSSDVWIPSRFFLRRCRRRSRFFWKMGQKVGSALVFTMTNKTVSPPDRRCSSSCLAHTFLRFVFCFLLVTSVNERLVWMTPARAFATAPALRSNLIRNFTIARRLDFY